MNTNKLQYLIKSCKKNKRDAQAELFKQLSPKMFAVCMYYAKNKEDAEDYLQNGFIKLFNIIHKYEFKGSFEAWVRKIFINMILEDFRKNKIQFANAPIDVLDISNNEVSINDQLNSQELIDLIQSLSPAYRIVFNLYAIEGYKHNEIAKKLNISEGTSKSNLARARKILQEKIKDLDQIRKKNERKD